MLAMASSLAAQLAPIAATASHQLDLKAQRKAHSQSFLFDSQAAAKQDFETIYQICVEGYQELCRIDPRFRVFAKTIFGEQSKQQERSQMTEHDNDKLNTILESFLSLISSRLLLAPAKKAIEWLIRRFRVHEHNTELLILAFLPYHTKPIFTNLLSILPQNLPISLKFLHPYIPEPQCPTVHTIVHTATNNDSFYRAWNMHVIRACQIGHEYPALISYWTTISTEGLVGRLDQAATGSSNLRKRKEDDVLHLVLPFLEECLSMHPTSDLRIGCYVMLLALASKVDLKDDVRTKLMEAIVHGQKKGLTNVELICLAVISQQRKTVKLPKAVFKAVMAMDTIEEYTIAMSKSYEIGNLLLGIILGVLRGLKKKGTCSHLTLIRTAVEHRMMKDAQLLIAIKAILKTANETDFSEDDDANVRSELAGIIFRIGESESVGSIMEEAIKETDIDMQLLEVKLQSLIVSGKQHLLPMLEAETMDVDASSINAQGNMFANIKSRIPTKTAFENSFLSHAESFVFGSLADAFILASASVDSLKEFEDLPVMLKGLAAVEPLYISFFVRFWCGSHSNASRAAAIHSVTQYTANTRPSCDLQLLLPYVCHGLADQSSLIRKASADLTAVLAQQIREILGTKTNSTTPPILGRNNLYGDGEETKSVSWLAGDEERLFLEQILLPNLEECRLDAAYIGRLIQDSLTGPSQNKTTKMAETALRTSTRNAIFRSLCSHATSTPVRGVKLWLLTVLNGIDKVGSTTRTNELLPLLRAQMNQNWETLKKNCQSCGIDSENFLSEVVKIVLPSSHEGHNFLNEIVMSDDSVPIQFKIASLNRIEESWQSMKSDLKSDATAMLFRLACIKDGQGPQVEIQPSTLGLLRRIRLSSDLHLELLEALPPLSVEKGEKSPNTKRQKTVNGHTGDEQDQGQRNELSVAIRKTNIVLELIDSAKHGASSRLIGPLFAVLKGLQDCHNNSGIQVGYVQSLTLDCLRSSVDKIKANPSLPLDRHAILAGSVIECFCNATKPQVHQAALLLLSSLATVAPELIINTVMPVFTSMGDSILQQSDDFSAHVIDQTIDSIIPPLITALQKEKGGALAGASQLLLSFVAAWAHIPIHRRLDLFYSLADKLGSKDSLFALLIMLVDKYGSNDEMIKFAIDLTSRHTPLVQLKTTEKCLEVIIDYLKPKPTISGHMVIFNERRTPIATTLNLLVLPAAIIRPTTRLGPKLNNILIQEMGDGAEIRETYSGITTQVIHLADSNRDQKKVALACETLLDTLAGLLNLKESIRSLEPVLEQGPTDIKQQVLKALEHRIDLAKVGDHSAQAACLNFLPRLEGLLIDDSAPAIKHTALGCVDRIADKFGKLDTGKMSHIASIISGNSCLGSKNSRLEEMSIICLTTLAEVLKDAMLPILPRTIPQTLDLLDQFLSEPSSGILHNTMYSFFEALFLYIPWIMTGEFLDRLLTVSYKSANAGLDISCNNIRQDTLNILSKQVDVHACFSSLTRTWKASTAEGVEAITELLDVAGGAIERHSTASVVKSSQLTVDLLLEIFDLRRLQLTDSAASSLTEEQLGRIEQTAYEVTMKMIYKLNDTHFRPLFNRMLEWATNALPKKDNQGRVSRLITWYSFLNSFSDSLTHNVTSYGGYIGDNAAATLTSIDLGDKECQVLWHNVLTALRSMFENDHEHVFWQSPRRFDTISKAIVEQIARVTSEAATSTLSSCITALAEAVESPDHRKAMNAAILFHMRSEHTIVRLAATRCEIELTEKLGDGWLSLLPEMLPFISEAMEDDDEGVEAEVRKWVRAIEEILGESLDGMLQ